MTNEEAIKMLKKARHHDVTIFDMDNYYNALDIAIEALKKEIPKPISIENGFVKCGGCGMYIRFPIMDHYNNCPECGQKILWKGDGMTREEAKDYIREWCPYDRQEEIIKALEQEPCEDAVSRQEAIEAAKYIWESNSEMKSLITIKMLEELPPVAPKQRVGKWIDDKCSVCGKGIEDLISSPEWYRNEEPNFCPYCGVKLEGE